MMQQSLRGEMTTGRGVTIKDFDLVDAVARSLNLSTPNELFKLGSTLFPAMLNSAVMENDLQKIDMIKNYGADLSIVNSDHRTALHLAVCVGSKEIVKYLLTNGASVHLRDRYDNTPLNDAISNDRHEIIQMLMACGAHLSSSFKNIGELTCNAAARGSITRLESYRLAGANLSQQDNSGRTPLHLACLHGYVDAIEFLKQQNVNENILDLLGLSPLDYAKLGNQENVVNMLTSNVV